jgi:hypothetical protein
MTSVPAKVQSVNDCWRYDACANEWLEAPPLMEARSHAGITYDSKGQPYVTGGTNDGEIMSSTEILATGGGDSKSWYPGNKEQCPIQTY